MKCIVCIKHVPDTETKIAVHADGNRLDPAAVSSWILSPFDEVALEQALLFREANGGEVIVVTAGSEGCQPSLRKALATGADKAVHIEDARLDDCDAVTRAEILAAYVRSESPDVVLLGKYGVGTDEGATGAMLAEKLDWDHVATVSALELTGTQFVAQRSIEGAVEIHEGSLPALFTCEKGLNTPRLPSLKGIMQSKKKPIDKKTVGDLGIDESSLSDRRLAWDSLSLPPERAAGRLIEGDAATAANELVRLLHEEAKVL
jgi:electron transfer flavoprotein beta subunit